MTRKKQTDIKKTLKGYYESFQKDGEPISVNFRALVPELKKPERYTHLLHSYPAKLLANIPYFFFATDALCPANGTVEDPEETNENENQNENGSQGTGGSGTGTTGSGSTETGGSGTNTNGSNDSNGGSSTGGSSTGSETGGDNTGGGGGEDEPGGDDH